MASFGMMRQAESSETASLAMTGQAESSRADTGASGGAVAVCAAQTHMMLAAITGSTTNGSRTPVVTGLGSTGTTRLGSTETTGLGVTESAGLGTTILGNNSLWTTRLGSAETTGLCAFITASANIIGRSTTLDASLKPLEAAFVGTGMQP